MRKLLIGFFLIAFAFSLILGCSAKESSDDASKMPEDTKQAESMDTTSMDSAMQMADSMMSDSSADMMEEGGK